MRSVRQLVDQIGPEDVEAPMTSGRLQKLIGFARHIGGFVGAGATATLVDLAVLNALYFVGIDPRIGRLASINVAMIASWWINRRFTFKVTTPPTWREYGKFAAVSWIAQAVNYTIFAGLVTFWSDLSPSLALILASPPAILVAYAGFRFGVFRRPAISSNGTGAS